VAWVKEVGHDDDDATDEARKFDELEGAWEMKVESGICGDEKGHGIL
jgi:hypothetical protein